MFRKILILGLISSFIPSYAFGASPKGYIQKDEELTELYSEDDVLYGCMVVFYSAAHLAFAQYETGSIEKIHREIELKIRFEPAAVKNIFGDFQKRIAYGAMKLEKMKNFNKEKAKKLSQQYAEKFYQDCLYTYSKGY